MKKLRLLFNNYDYKISEEIQICRRASCKAHYAPAESELSSDEHCL